MSFGSMLMLCLAAPLSAQTQPAAPTLPDPSNAPVALIRTFIDQNLRLLEGSDADAARARQSLLAPLSTTNLAPAFLDNYARNLQEKATPALSEMSQVGRLNLAIVVNRVSAASESIALDPLITRLLQDDSPAVVLWGAKAAGPLLPAIVNAKSTAPLQAISDAFKKFPNEPAVLAELYAALTLRLSDTAWLKNAQTSGLLTTAAPPIVATIQSTLQQRMQGNDILFESGSLPVILDYRYFNLLTPAQQDLSLKLAIQGVTRLSEAAEAAEPVQKRTLVRQLQTVASSLSVVAQSNNLGAPVVTTTNALRNNISAVSPPGAIKSLSEAAVQSIHNARPLTKNP